MLAIGVMMSVNLNLNIQGADCCCIIKKISKNEAVDLLRDPDLTEKNGVIIKHKIFNCI